MDLETKRRIMPIRDQVEGIERKDRTKVSRERTKANDLSLSIPMLPLDLFLPILPGPNLNLASCMRTSRHRVPLWMPLWKLRERSLSKRMVVEML